MDLLSERILKTEYSNKFDSIRKDMMIMSYYKYGPLQTNHGKENHMDAIANLKLRLAKYEETGNTEYLCDVANFAMIEFMSPQKENAVYVGTDNSNCKLEGFGINEIIREMEEN